MTRLLFGCILIFLAGIPITTNAQKPNFIIIYADDMGYGDPGYLGSEDLQTPHLDQLAAEGVAFSQGYVSASVCGPSRCGLLTGVYQQALRAGENAPENAWQDGDFPMAGLTKDQPIVSEMLQGSEYRSLAVGKWHLGMDESLRPLQRGFDEFYGFLNGSHDYYRADMNFEGSPAYWPMFKDNDIVPYEGYTTEVFSEKTVDFIHENADNPFFVYLAYNAVHHPWQVPQSYMDRLPHIEDEDRLIFGGMMLAMDDGIGQIVNALKEEGVYENTVIFFISDNGSPKGQSGNMSSTGGLRGWKGDTYEGGIRVPFVLRWPGLLDDGSWYDQPVSNLDVVPTIMSYLNVENPTKEGLAFDGVDLLPYMLGDRGAQRPHDIMYWRRDNHYALRKGDWKLCWNDGDIKDGNPMLFNLETDREEKENLFSSEVAIAEEMQEIFDAWDGYLPDHRWWGRKRNRNYREYLIEDFEGPAAKWSVFKPIGLTTTAEVIQNPYPTAGNDSEFVLKIGRSASFDKPFAGAWSSITDIHHQLPYLHMRVYNPRKSVIKVQLEDGQNRVLFESLNPYKTTGEWQDMVFDIQNFDGVIRVINIQPDHNTEFIDNEILIDDIFLDFSPIARDAGKFTGDKVENLRMEAEDDGHMDIAWDAVAGALTYQVFVNGKPLAITTELMYQLAKPNPGTRDEVVVVALNEFHEPSLASEVLNIFGEDYVKVMEDFEVNDGKNFVSNAVGKLSVNSNPSAWNTSLTCLELGDLETSVKVEAEVAPFDITHQYFKLVAKSEQQLSFQLVIYREDGTQEALESEYPYLESGNWQRMAFDLAAFEGETFVKFDLNISNRSTQSSAVTALKIDEIQLDNEAPFQVEDPLSVTLDFDQMQFFPNPTKGAVYFNPQLQGQKVYLYTLSGRLVKSFHLPEHETSISLADLKLGSYLVTVPAWNKQFSQRLVLAP
ncbi:sulfatase-like hydrolase/transferase [Persicobacter diffluens]|uniref:Sulfatase N-terminal domain-containing protein n=1 Tax=Persicobacter diffluens TaxID=981 RepID=A0AAN4W1A1_9BACT|nr:hypothetical protein PEDI_32220 [Persicobacter diffluens]